MAPLSLRARSSRSPRHNGLSLNVETKPRKKPRHREQNELHIPAVQLLNVILPATCLLFHIPNGGQRSPVEAAIFTRLGVRAGMPNLAFVYSGRFFAIELKHKDNPVDTTIEQNAAHAKIRDAGGRVEVARSIEQVIAHLVDFGIPLKAHYLVERARKQRDRDEADEGVPLAIGNAPAFLFEKRTVHRDG